MEGDAAWLGWLLAEVLAEDGEAAVADDCGSEVLRRMRATHLDLTTLDVPFGWAPGYRCRMSRRPRCLTRPWWCP